MASVIRWGGMAAIVGGILWITTIVVTAFKPEHPRRGPEGFTVLLLVALPLIGMGVVGIFLKQKKASGRLGRRAALLSLLGLAIMVPGRVIEPAYFFQAGLLLFFVGLGLLVVSVFVARVLPMPSALMLAIGALSLPLFNFGDERIWIGALFGAGWIWTGYSLWSGGSDQRLDASHSAANGTIRPKTERDRV